MKNHNTIGVDLAKNVIYVSVLSSRQKLLQSKEVTRSKFKPFLANQKPAMVAFEACATAHYWSRFAQSHGHTTKIIPALAVVPFGKDIKQIRMMHWPSLKPPIGLILKKRLIKPSTSKRCNPFNVPVSYWSATERPYPIHIRGILLEFGFAIRQGYSALYQHVPDILEDGENELPDSYRATLNMLYVRLRDLREVIDFMDKRIATVIKQNPACRQLTKMEGVGPIGAILLFSSLGTGEAFKNGREYSAYLGLTPKQFSSGGKTNLVGISKYVANKRLRSILIQGARAYIHKAKLGNTVKDQWLLALIDRAGTGKAAVALANKNVRTAWALLTQGTEYQKTVLIG